jgi:two-component system sensor histidine kinase KdpD
VSSLTSPEGAAAPPQAGTEQANERLRLRPLPTPPVLYLAAFGAVAVATGLAGLAYSHGLAHSVGLLYLVAIVLVGARLGMQPALLAALVAAIAHAYFFLPPLFGFPTAPEHISAAMAFFAVALVVGSLTARLRAAADTADRRARQADALRSLTRALASHDGIDDLLATAAAQTGVALGGRALVVVDGPDGAVAHGESGRTEAPPDAVKLAREAVARRQLVRSEGSDPPAVSAAAPLSDRAGQTFALVIRRPPNTPWTAENGELLEGIALLTGDALERARLTEHARRAEVDSRTERLRNSLLSSVSHDLRTPLAVILGATSHLADCGARLPEEERTSLAREAEREADRLNRLVNNLIAMTRLEAGAIRPTKEWQPLDDVIGSAVARMEKAFAGRPVNVDLEADLPLVPVDAVLVEQVLVNLIDNACRYTPAGSEIAIRARRAGSELVVVEVLDRGPGIPPGQEESVFERLRVGLHRPGHGVGLGLAICRGIVTVHGGSIWVQNRPGGGAAFLFTLPLDGLPPPSPAREADVTGAAT